MIQIFYKNVFLFHSFLKTSGLHLNTIGSNINISIDGGGE